MYNNISKMGIMRATAVLFIICIIIVLATKTFQTNK